MNHATPLVGILLTFGIPLAAILTSTAVVYAQQLSSSSSSPAAGDSSSLSNTILSEIKAKMCNPSNPTLKVVNTTEARICGIPKTVGPALASSVAPQPKTTTSSSPSVAPLAHSFKNTGSSNNTSSRMITTTTTNVPIVLRPLPGGTCPTGYHLVSKTVCIKDMPSSAQQQTTPAALIPTTTNVTKSLPISSSSATTQSSHNNPTKNDNKNAANSNNEENFHTKILKSFNKKFK
ncbi:MAG: hypothetical protein ACJ71L_11570 [Nitrososphaeraceae archaeon]